MTSASLSLPILLLRKWWLTPKKPDTNCWTELICIARTWYRWCERYKKALRWAFDKAKPGEVSGLYECGESDHMMVVGLVNIKPEGYRPLKAVQEQLRAEIVKDKKAEKIMADMKAANATSLDQYKGYAERCQRFFENGNVCCSGLCICFA